MILQLLTLVGALGMFLYGMNMMSTGLQKAAGNKLRNFLAAMTSNRVKSVITGFTITSVIQSSSATTVMVVGFVNAGLLLLTQAIGVIMGANIGTTITAWLISLLGFKMDISVFAVPLMAVGFVMSLSSKDKYKNISEFIIGFSLLFLGLSLMKSSVPDLEQTPEILSFISKWTKYGFGSVLIFLILGTILTLVLQSSSATMALTLIMMSLGWIPFSMAAAMVLGENIGTTITANIAASVGNTSAKRAAMAHTLFNLFGVIWALILFTPFLQLVGLMISWMGYPNPNQLTYGATIESGSTESTAALYGVSMLHTLFNTINTLLLIWFIPQIKKTVTSLIKSKQDDEEDVLKLKYMEAGPLTTAELTFAQAEKEIIHFAEISKRGINFIYSAIHAKNEDEFEKYRKKLVKYEEIADRIENEIGSFLNALPKEGLSEKSLSKSRSYYKIISELESLGDSGESISRILSRRNLHGKHFTERHIDKIDQMIEITRKAYDIMIDNLKTGEVSANRIKKAIDCETSINTLRNNLREEELSKMDKGDSNYQDSAYYIDVISEIEHMGDYLINISQALEKK